MQPSLKEQYKSCSQNMNVVRNLFSHIFATDFPLRKHFLNIECVLEMRNLFMRQLKKLSCENLFNVVGSSSIWTCSILNIEYLLLFFSGRHAYKNKTNKYVLPFHENRYILYTKIVSDNACSFHGIKQFKYYYLMLKDAVLGTAFPFLKNIWALSI